MFHYCLYFFIGFITIKRSFIVGGIINRDDVNDFNPKVWNELSLFDQESKVVPPELWKKTNENNEITFPYKIEKDLHLDINYKPLEEVEIDQNIPTLWSFMDKDGSGERKKIIQEESDDPFNNTKN